VHRVSTIARSATGLLWILERFCDAIVQSGILLSAGSPGRLLSSMESSPRMKCARRGGWNPGARARPQQQQQKEAA
jgi:hypothetical protein